MLESSRTALAELSLSLSPSGQCLKRCLTEWNYAYRDHARVPDGTLLAEPEGIYESDRTTLAVLDGTMLHPDRVVSGQVSSDSDITYAVQS